MGNALNYSVKLSTIETSAVGDLVASEVKTIYESNADTNALNDADKAKLTNLDDGTYITPTMLNGWINHSTTYQYAGYRKDEYGMVHIRGLVKNGTVDTAVFTLPVGYRPANSHIFSTDSNSVVERVDVTAAGSVMAYTASNAWFSIECSFKAEQ